MTQIILRIWFSLDSTIKVPEVYHLVDWWLISRMCIPGDLRKGFDSMVLLITWMIWKEHNHRVFDNSCTLPPGLVTVVVEKQLD